MPINKVQYGNQVLIDLTNSSLQSSDELISGVTAYDRSGTKLTGTAVLEDELNIIDRRKTYTYNDVLEMYNNGKPFVIDEVEFTAFVYQQTLDNNLITFNTYCINPITSKPARMSYSINSSNQWSIGVGVEFATSTDLDSKQNTLISGTNIKTINSNSILGSGNLTINKSSVGLGNVDNTSDLNKPISTATQTALDGKVSKAGDTMTGELTISKTGQTMFKASRTGGREVFFGVGSSGKSGVYDNTASKWLLSYDGADVLLDGLNFATQTGTVTPVTTNFTNSSFVLQKTGRVCNLYYTGKFSVTASGWITIGTLPTGFRPTSNTVYSAPVRDSLFYATSVNDAQVQTDGNIRVYAWASNDGATLRQRITYICA